MEIIKMILGALMYLPGILLVPITVPVALLWLWFSGSL